MFYNEETHEQILAIRARFQAAFPIEAVAEAQAEGDAKKGEFTLVSQGLSPWGAVKDDSIDKEEALNQLALPEPTNDQAYFFARLVFGLCLKYFDGRKTTRNFRYDFLLDLRRICLAVDADKAKITQLFAYITALLSELVSSVFDTNRLSISLPKRNSRTGRFSGDPSSMRIRQVSLKFCLDQILKAITNIYTVANIRVSSVGTIRERHDCPGFPNSKWLLEFTEGGDEEADQQEASRASQDSFEPENDDPSTVMMAPELLADEDQQRRSRVSRSTRHSSEFVSAEEAETKRAGSTASDSGSKADTASIEVADSIFRLRLPGNVGEFDSNQWRILCKIVEFCNRLLEMTQRECDIYSICTALIVCDLYDLLLNERVMNTPEMHQPFLNLLAAYLDVFKQRRLAKQSRVLNEVINLSNYLERYGAMFISFGKICEETAALIDNLKEFCGQKALVEGYLEQEVQVERVGEGIVARLQLQARCAAEASQTFSRESFPEDEEGQNAYEEMLGNLRYVLLDIKLMELFVLPVFKMGEGENYKHALVYQFDKLNTILYQAQQFCHGIEARLMGLQNFLNGLLDQEQHQETLADLLHQHHAFSGKFATCHHVLTTLQALQPPYIQAEDGMDQGRKQAVGERIDACLGVLRYFTQARQPGAEGAAAFSDVSFADYASMFGTPVRGLGSIAGGGNANTPDGRRRLSASRRSSAGGVGR